MTTPLNQNQKYKISFCTVCMNRLEHLKQTLPKNIEDNIFYGNLEFLLLDYNSTDGLEEWVMSEMKKYIDSGILRYYKTTEPEYFHRSHSRNMIIKRATGDIVVNVDADNYTGKFFAAFINHRFAEDKNIILALDLDKQAEFAQAHGRFCAWKEDFLKVTGYDEKMDTYGYEDIDLHNRIELLGRKRVPIDNLFLKFIPHGNKERTANESLTSNLEMFLIRYVNQQTTEVFLLQRNKIFERTIITKPEEQKMFVVMGAIEKVAYKTGTWERTEDNIITINHSNGKTEKFTYEGNNIYSLPPNDRAIISVGERKYHHITHSKFIENFLMGYSRIINMERLENNMNSKIIEVNKGEIGKGEIVRSL